MSQRIILAGVRNQFLSWPVFVFLVTACLLPTSAQAACPADPCPLDAPFCINGECRACDPNELRCLGPIFEYNSTLLECNASGDGGQAITVCQGSSSTSSNNFCFEGLPFCGVGAGMCVPGSRRGCAGYARSGYLQCNLAGTAVELLDCDAGKVCVGAGGCVDRPIPYLEENPGPDWISPGDIAITEVPGATTAMMTFPGGAFASGNDLNFRVLDPNTVSYIVPSGVYGSGRSSSTSAARDELSDSVLTAWYKTTGTFPDDVDTIYYRWLNPNGSGSTSETLVGEGFGPDAVALGALTGAIVWDAEGVPTPGQLYESKGWYLCPGCSGGFPFPIAETGLSPGRPKVAPWGNGFVVVWVSGSPQTVYAQCFNSSVQPILGTPLEIAMVGNKVVAGAPGQGAVIVWDVNTGLRVRRIDTNCALAGDVIDIDPNRLRRDVEMWPNGRFIIAYESLLPDAFGFERPTIFTKQYSADGQLEEVAQVTPVGFAAAAGLSVGAWGSDSSIVVWSESPDEGLFARQPCATDITWANEVVSQERARNATATATLGPNLTLGGVTISVNAPAISFTGPVEIGGDFVAGNAGDCPSQDACPGCLCGNGQLDPGEECDDGNPFNGDGCSAACIIEPFFIGDTGPAGGIVFHVTDGGMHGLEVAPVEQGTAQWGCAGTGTVPALGTDIGTGSTNTQQILNGCPDRPIAASVAAGYMGPTGDTNGWFLPSKDELNEIYENVHLVGLGSFSTGFHWSSSNYTFVESWAQRFSDGLQVTGNNASNSTVLAVREF